MTTSEAREGGGAVRKKVDAVEKWDEKPGRAANQVQMEVWARRRTGAVGLRQSTVEIC